VTLHRCVTSDPAWAFKDKLPGGGRGAVKHYNVEQLNKIIDYHKKVFSEMVEPTAWLFLWRVAAMQGEAFELVKALGFVVKADITWVKTKDPNRRRLQIGMGHYCRNDHETCLVCVRGKGAASLRLSKSETSVVFAPRTRHSEKPAEFMEKVERLCPGPRLELYARVPREGWTQLGDESGKAPLRSARKKVKRG